jgi:hypothetical protein
MIVTAVFESRQEVRFFIALTSAHRLSLKCLAILTSISKWTNQWVCCNLLLFNIWKNSSVLQRKQFYPQERTSTQSDRNIQWEGWLRKKRTTNRNEEIERAGDREKEGKKKWSYPRNRPWKTIGSSDAKDPTLSRQSAHRWR